MTEKETRSILAVATTKKPIAESYEITIIAVVLFILIFGIATFLSYRQLETARRHSLTNDKTTANLLADLVLGHNKATIGILESYARRPLFVEAVKKRDFASVQRHLLDLKKNADIDLTFVTDKSGILWANFPVFPEAIGKDLSSRDWYRGASAHWKPYISTAFQLIVRDKPLAVAFCVPVLDEKERIIGILATSQRLGFLVDAIQRVPLIPNTTLTVTDRVGQILYSNKFPYHENLVAYRLYSILEAMLKEKKQQLEIKDPQKDQGTRYITAVSIGDGGWSLVIERSLQDIYYSEITRVIAIGAISVLLYLLFMFYLVYLRKVSLLRKKEELLKSEIKLRQSEEKYRLMFEATISGFALLKMIYDEEGNPLDCCYVSVNPAHEKITGLKSSEIVGRTARECIPDLENYWIESYGKVDQTGEPIYLENRVKGMNKTLAVFAYRQEPGYVAVTFQDITERKHSEEKIQASLREKETLLKEIHHRVKNNLQIISSLLNLQAKSIEDEKMEAIFKECQGRIAAMAAVHQLLYKSQNFAEINFGEYLKETAGQLFRSYKTGATPISLVIQAENVMLSIDTAIPCGLIINELVTNALKYAFPGIEKGEIKIEMSQTKQGLSLLFEDNGIGFPKDVDFSNSVSTAQNNDGQII
ncbi:MAG: sensor histidine kinase [Syntrophales bacterium]